MVGDFDVDRMEAKIRAAFDSWRGRGTAGGEPQPGLVAQRPTEARIRVEPAGGPRVSMSWVRAPDLRPDTRARRAERFQARNRIDHVIHTGRGQARSGGRGPR